MSRFQMVASLDRFIKKSVLKIFYSLQNGLGFQMVSAILFLPFESRTNRSSPDHLKAGLASLDRFTNEGH
jgi:hypothetical protein